MEMYLLYGSQPGGNIFALLGGYSFPQGLRLFLRGAGRQLKPLSGGKIVAPLEWCIWRSSISIAGRIPVCRSCN